MKNTDPFEDASAVFINSRKEPGEERRRFFQSTRPVVFWLMNTHRYIYITEPASNVIMHECVESV